MAAGRPGDFELSASEFERLEAALKDAEFRKLLLEYCEEIQAPENRKKYQHEFTEMERQRGHIVEFLEPEPGYVVKTSSGGDKKTFINVCSNRNIQPPTCSGLQLTLPHAVTPSKDHKDASGRKCVVYDAIFHPNTLSLASKSGYIKNLVTSTACDAVQQSHQLTLDTTNLKFPKSTYKGPKVPTVTRKPDPNYEQQPPSVLDEIYPQKSYVQQSPQIINPKPKPNSDYTIPKYILKQSRNIDLKEFTYEKEAKQHTAMPNNVILEIYLPLLFSTSEATLDVQGKNFKLTSEKPARYNLEVMLPYAVNDEAGSAKFDLDKRVLIVTLPVIPSSRMYCTREDSGVESDTNSPCPSDEDNTTSLVTEISDDAPGIEVISESEAYRTSDEEFFEPSLCFSAPTYICNVVDSSIVFTLQVKNVDPDSISTKNDANQIKVKFSSIGAGYFPIHYGLIVKLPNGDCGTPSVEAWDNNVTMQFDVQSTVCIDHCFVGLYDNDIKKEILEASIPPTKIVDEINEEQICTNFKDAFHISKEYFLESDLSYSLPNYTLNVLDNIIAFTFHVKNVEAASFSSQISKDGVWLKFSSLNGERIVTHYVLCIKFPFETKCQEPSIDAWDNNTVMQLEFLDKLPESIYVGSTDGNMKKHVLDTLNGQDITLNLNEQFGDEPIVEVIAKGNNETNISLSPSEGKFEKIKAIPKRVTECFDNAICSSSGGSFKGILKCKSRIGRSFSESSVDLVEYNMSPSYSISSADCIPEESCSLKKTVRFSNVIAKQTFRFYLVFNMFFNSLTLKT